MKHFKNQEKKRDLNIGPMDNCKCCTPKLIEPCCTKASMFVYCITYMLLLGPELSETQDSCVSDNYAEVWQTYQSGKETLA